MAKINPATDVLITYFSEVPVVTNNVSQEESAWIAQFGTDFRQVGLFQRKNGNNYSLILADFKTLEIIGYYVDGQGSSGIFNTASMPFVNMDFTTEDFTKYYGVSIQGTNILGTTYILSNASVLQYFQARLNTDIVNLEISDNLILKGVDMFNYTSITNVNITGNPLLNFLHVRKQGATPDGLITDITITGSPLLNSVNLQKNTLNVASVDGVLAYLDANGLLGGSVFLDLGTNSAPTGGALNPNVVSLLGKGWTVAHN